MATKMISASGITHAGTKVKLARYNPSFKHSYFSLPVLNYTQEGK